MPHPKTVHCKLCHRHTDECGPLSARKKCASCAESAVIENNTAMAEKSGPEYDRWRAAMARAVTNLDTGGAGTGTPATTTNDSDTTQQQ